MVWRPAGLSVYLPLLIFPCTIKSRSSLLALAHLGGPGKRVVKYCIFSLLLHSCGSLKKFGTAKKIQKCKYGFFCWRCSLIYGIICFTKDTFGNCWSQIFYWVECCWWHPLTTSGQGNLATSNSAAAHGWFSGICQLAPVCTPNNARFPGPIRAHNPNSISIGW